MSVFCDTLIMNNNEENQNNNQNAHPAYDYRGLSEEQQLQLRLLDAEEALRASESAYAQVWEN